MTTEQKKQHTSSEGKETAGISDESLRLGSLAAKETALAHEQAAIRAHERTVSPTRTPAEDVEQERALILAHIQVGDHVAEHRRQLQGGQRDHLRDMVRRGYAAAASANTIGEFDPSPFGDVDDRAHEDRLHGTSTQVVAKGALGRRGPSIF